LFGGRIATRRCLGGESAAEVDTRSDLFHASEAQVEIKDLKQAPIGETKARGKEAGQDEAMQRRQRAALQDDAHEEAVQRRVEGADQEDKMLFHAGGADMLVAAQHAHATALKCAREVDTDQRRYQEEELLRKGASRSLASFRAQDQMEFEVGYIAPGYMELQRRQADAALARQADQRRQADATLARQAEQRRQWTGTAQQTAQKKAARQLKEQEAARKAAAQYADDLAKIHKLCKEAAWSHGVSDQDALEKDRLITSLEDEVMAMSWHMSMQGRVQFMEGVVRGLAQRKANAARAQLNEQSCARAVQRTEQDGLLAQQQQTAKKDAKRERKYTEWEREREATKERIDQAAKTVERAKMGKADQALNDQAVAEPLMLRKIAETRMAGRPRTQGDEGHPSHAVLARHQGCY
jgi:hypothetical protein